MVKLSEELRKLGEELGRDFKELNERYGHACGDALLRNFARSFDLPDETKLEVETDKGTTALVHISRVRKILAGAPPSEIASMGNIGKREAALALLRMKTRRE
ncbi:MAG: hypothetical protein AB1393_01240 [Candidatus Edwardsbacteria bacterium]